MCTDVGRPEVILSIACGSIVDLSQGHCKQHVMWKCMRVPTPVEPLAESASGPFVSNLAQATLGGEAMLADVLQ